MSGIKQHFIDWLYVEFQKKEFAIQARNWQPLLSCCVYCHQPLTRSYHYCPFCGGALARQVTDELSLGAAGTHIDTAMILACRLPGERLMATYLRLRGLKKIMQEEE